MYLWNDRGDKIIDASSGLFCVSAGHGRKEIADAVGAQLRELDFCAPFLRAHPKQFELATRVAELTPGDLNRIFFVNSGSESVDTAMKVALAYHQARGQGGRNIFVSRERAYHGVNFGGVALSGLVNNRRKFGPGLPGIAHMRHTHLKENFFTQGRRRAWRRAGRGSRRASSNLYGAENIAACFVEPIAGSTGCLVPPKGYLKRLREICDAHGILLVFDEVICGFGRTGQTFAAQSFGVTPDILTMAKGITNGAQPMGAVAVSERIHDTIMARRARGRDRVLPRLHVFRPSGVRARRASRRSTSTRTKACSSAAASCRRISSTRSSRCKDVPVVADIRGYGMFAAIDVHADGAPGQARPGRSRRSCSPTASTSRRPATRAIIAPPLIAEKTHVDDDRGHPAQDAQGALTQTGFGRAVGDRTRTSGLASLNEGDRMKRIVAGLLFAAFAAAPAWAQKEVTIGYQDMVVPYRIAQEAKEIEKATGYKVNWKQFGGGGEVIKAMASGAVQIGEVGSAGIAAAVSRGEPLELFWILDDIGDAEALVAKNGSGINTLADLKGKKIAMPFNSTTHFHTMVALEQAKVNPADVQILNMRPPEVRAAWQRGDIQATFIWDPVLAEVKKDGKVILTSGKISADTGKATFDGYIVEQGLGEGEPATSW